MKPYYTILLDSLRMLKSTAIFWVTLGISLLVALIYLSIGFDDEGMTLFFGLSSIESEALRKGSPGAETLYVAIFTKLIAGYWLSWIAVLLALISCASIFPETLKEGSAGMVLTKKLSRLQVFVAKFAGSLLFVTIQVVLFVMIVFIALKWRVGSWNPSIFWYVPLILLVFTYLYSFMVLIAVKTKSVMTALILTLVLWALSSFVGWIEGTVYEAIHMFDSSESYASLNPELEADAISEDEEGEVELERYDDHSNDEMDSSSMKSWHRGIVTAYAIFPKTGRTMDVADRFLVVNGKKGGSKGSFMSILLGLDAEQSESEFITMKKEAADRHSTGYVIGTSVIFAFVMLSLAAWIFCRKEI